MQDVVKRNGGEFDIAKTYLSANNIGSFLHSEVRAVAQTRASEEAESNEITERGGNLPSSADCDPSSG